MALIVVNAMNSRQGGGLVFADMALPRLAEHLSEKGHRVRILDHTFLDSQRSGIRTVSAQRLLSSSCISADFILNMGNVAALFTSATPQWLVVTNRLLVERQSMHRATHGIRLNARRSLLFASMLKSERWIVPGRAMGSALLARCKRWRLPPRPLEILPHGVREISPVARRAIPPGIPYRAVYPASAYPHKNFATLIQAVHRARAAGRDVRLTLTIERHQLPALMLNALVPSDVDTWLDCVGQVSHSLVDELYCTHDVLLFPSECESFGIPLIEAAAHCLPVIASDLDVTREVAPQGTCFVPALDVEGWKDALISFARLASKSPSHGGLEPLSWNAVADHLALAIMARMDSAG